MFYHDFVDYDDGRMIINRADKYDGINLSNIKGIFLDDYPREEPLVVRDLSYLVNAQIFGTINPFGYLLGNFLLHIIVSWLVYFLYLELFQGKNNCALFAALLFAVHPIHVESVAWASSRKDVLYATFFLAGFLSYLKFFRLLQYRYLIVSFALFTLALFSKSAAISFLLVVLVARFSLLRGHAGRMFESTYYGCIGALTLVFVWWYSSRLLSYGVILEQAQYHRNWGQWFLFNMEIVTFYLGKMFYPVGLSSFYDYPAIKFIFKKISFFILSGGVLVLICLSAWRFSRMKDKRALFVLGWFICTLLPYLNIANVGIYFADRYLYLASVSFCFMLAWVFDVIVAWVRTINMSLVILPFVGAILLTVLLTVQTITTVDNWKSSGSFWKNANNIAPDQPVPYGELINQYLNFYMEYPDDPQAMDALREARRIGLEAVENFCPQANVCKREISVLGPYLGRLFWQLDEDEKAGFYLRLSLAISPDNMVARSEYAHFLLAQGKYDAALEQVVFIEQNAKSYFYKDIFDDIQENVKPELLEEIDAK